MAERAGPQVYSIAAHRGFADALVAGLVPRYHEPDFGLARLTLLLPSRRAARTITEAFVRLSGGGLLLPRMAVVGDLDLDETLGPLLDPLGAGADIPPAADPVYRWLRLARYLREVKGDAAGNGAALLRQAQDIGATMDKLLVEGITPDDLMSDRVVGIVGELAAHWEDSTRTFLEVQARWLIELATRGEVDAPTRRNLLFEHATRRWKESPPKHPVVAAGVTSASPALARLLRAVANMPNGAVILPDLDLALDSETWAALGTAGAPDGPDDPPFGPHDAVTHPQYHLKLLLNRMGIARGEVAAWHRKGVSASPPERSRAISNLFLPPEQSACWVDLPAEQRRLSGVRLMHSATPGAEAQAIAILVREALETPERRVAVVTPDRGLAARVVAQLERWGIRADDSAGQPLPQTPAGRFFLLLAEIVAEDAAPVPLVAMLLHPLAAKGEARADWLDKARALDLALRGPRPAPGLAPLAAIAEKAQIGAWWSGVEAILSPLFAHEAEPLLSDQIAGLVGAAEALCGEGIWSEADGRELAGFVEALRSAADAAGTRLDPRDLHAVLRDAMDRSSVRPPWGGHPRIAIYGLLEARMSRADLVICGGMVEGVWPASATPDALLPPPVLRALGVPGSDFRIGLAAHDLAGALGAPEVVLSWAERDESAPVIASRFVLRIKALLGDLADRHKEETAVILASAIDDTPLAQPYPRPRPMPDAQQRRVDVSVTGLDRLRSDPYQFYANAILRLRSIDGLDAEPSAAWKGEAVHEILDRWHKAGDPPGGLHDIAEQVMDEMSAHPLMRSLWRPRLIKALEWIDSEVARQKAEDGRSVAVTEAWGDMEVRGIRIHGRADRIDRLENGALAIVDYKTGQPPSAKMVQQGYSLQLGLIGMIAADGGFGEVSGEPEAFEYWSLARDIGNRQERAFGYVKAPFKARPGEGDLTPDRFLEVTGAYLDDALDRWILGTDAFTARLNPDLPSYTDYDQLMRLDEWLPHMDPDEEDAA